MAKTVTTYSRGRLIGSGILTAIDVGLTWAIIYYFAILPLPPEYAEFIHIMHDLHWNLAVAIFNPIAWSYFLGVAFDVLIILIGLYGSYWVLGHFAAYARDAGLWVRLKRAGSPMIKRWDPWQRAQHILMFVTFVICAFTGFVTMLDGNPLWRQVYINGLVSFSGSPPYFLWPSFTSPYPLIILIHIISGIIMGFLVLAHFGYYGARVIVDKIKGYSILEKWPLLQIYTWGFVKYMWHRSIWLINPRHPLPKWVHKYDPEELFEYWGVYWGIAVLGIPGIIMAVWGPSAGAGVAFVMHTKEAVLAVTFLLLVHLTYTHFNPRIFPYREVFHSGKIPLDIVKEEHPNWYEELKREGVVKEDGSK